VFNGHRRDKKVVEIVFVRFRAPLRCKERLRR
jgi:hypothetical protein